MSLLLFRLVENEGVEEYHFYLYTDDSQVNTFTVFMKVRHKQMVVLPPAALNSVSDLLCHTCLLTRRYLW